MNIEYNRSSLIRLENGRLAAVLIEGIKTGVKAIDSTSKQSTLGRRGDSIRYDIFHADQGEGRYAFHLRIPDSICLAVEDIESVLGKLELYVIDFRGSLDSKGRPAKLSPRDYWQFISVLRHPVLRGQQWMLKYSYENEDSPRPRCLETLTVMNPEEPFDPIIWKYRLFKK